MHGKIKRIGAPVVFLATFYIQICSTLFSGFEVSLKMKHEAKTHSRSSGYFLMGSTGLKKREASILNYLL